MWRALLTSFREAVAGLVREDRTLDREAVMCPRPVAGESRLILTDHFGSEAGVVCEPPHMDCVVKGGVGRGSEGS